MDFETFQRSIKTLDFGKDLPEAIYLHRFTLEHIPSELEKIILGIAKALGISTGDWDIVKLFKRDFKISYLSYPDFFDYPYPCLKQSYAVDLTKKSSRIASYKESENPPILHRRELFLHPSHPEIENFSVFTSEGERLGLYQNTRVIGTLHGWSRAIKRSGHMLDDEGHIVPLTLVTPTEEVPESFSSIHRHKTAISRDKLSVPLFILARTGYLDGRYSVLDYGCGRGDDIRELEANHISCIGWDPVHRPDVEIESCDIVNLGYVINVIEDIDERVETIKTAFSLAEKILVVSAMLGNDSIVERFKPYKDGVITKAKTFQKYYYQTELKEFVERTLSTEAIAAGPGLFLVFRDKVEEQRYLSERQRTRLNWRQISARPKALNIKTPSRSKIEKNEEILTDFWCCCLDLGRPATNDEFDHSDQIRHIFGSHANALSICQAYFQAEDLKRSEGQRKDDLLVYLALEHFGKRQAYRRMPESLQKDIRYHFGKYQEAREAGRQLLFSTGDTQLINIACKEAYSSLPASQLTEDHDLVFQTKYLNLCPAVLRVYIGCALQLYGDLDSIDLIKVHIQSGKVTLMVYEGFDDNAIPLLKERIKIKLQEQDIDFFDYVYEYRPQPLLMKSKIISSDHPRYEEQLQFDSALLAAVGPELMEIHLSADRLDFLLKENGIRLNNFKVNYTS